MTLEQKMPKFCGKAFTKLTCTSIPHCWWYDDPSEYQFTEERLDLCDVRDDDTGCDDRGLPEYDDFVWVSKVANHRPDWRGVLGPKNHSGNEYLELGTASDRARGFEPSWLKVKLDGTLVSRVVVQVKAAQSKMKCNGFNGFFPATRAACYVYSGNFGEPAAIHAVLLTEGEHNHFIDDESFVNFIRMTRQSGPCSPSAVPGPGSIVPTTSWYTNTRIKPESLALCLDKSDGCDPLTLDFRKVAAKQSRDSPHCEGGQIWWEDRNEAEFKAADYLYLWFPHGYLHLWSIDIYHVPKHYDRPDKKTYDFQDAVRVKERMRKVRDVFEHRPYSDWKRWAY